MMRFLAIGVLAFALTGCGTTGSLLTPSNPKTEQLPNWLQDSQPTTPSPSSPLPSPN